MSCLSNCLVINPNQSLERDGELKLKNMNANERKKIVKLIEPNILPNAVRIKVTVTDDENIIEEVQQVEETVELIEELEVLDTVVDDDDDNEEAELEDMIQE